MEEKELCQSDKQKKLKYICFLSRDTKVNEIKHVAL